jgi:AAA ATPase domain
MRSSSPSRARRTRRRPQSPASARSSPAPGRTAPSSVRRALRRAPRAPRGTRRRGCTRGSDPGSRPTNLPLQPTALVGRGRELDDLCALVRTPGVRLVALTGPGGTGKTRLALQAAAELADDFSDGTFFVSLAPIEDPELVPVEVAQTIGVNLNAGQTIAGFLRQGAAARPRQPGAAAACRPRHRRAARLRGRADGDRDEPAAAAHQGRARLSRSAPPRGGGGRALRRARMRRRPHLRADGRERRCGGRGLRASGRPSARGRARRRARHRSVTRSDAPPHLRAGDGRRPGRPGAAAHAAWDDRLELPAVGRERPRALRARGRLPRRVHARGSRGGLRGDVRGRRVARRQEPHFLALAERSYAERLLDDAGNRVAADL